MTTILPLGSLPCVEKLAELKEQGKLPNTWDLPRPEVRRGEKKPEQSCAERIAERYRVNF